MTPLIDWTTIDTVLLDMDGTLLDLRFDNHFWLHHLPQCYAKLNNISLNQASRYLTDRFDAQRGTINWYCLDYWSAELKLDIVQLKSEVAHLVAIHPHVIRFLTALQDNGHHRVLVTNAHQKSLQIKLAQTQLNEHLDTIICAHDVGLAKEETAFWSELQQYTAYDPNRTLLIDDNLDVLRSAKKGGIQHLLAITQPDSSKPLQNTAEFAAITLFSEIMPGC